ncbi:MAG: PAS domain S-box protein [Bacteroidales bacterium]|jgi:PAS domain S-box-containing protein
MEKNTLLTDDLLRENRELRLEVERLQKERIDLGHLSGIIADRKRNEQVFKRINEDLLSLSHSFEDNVNLLTRLCGELTGAACTLYNRLEDGLLVSVGQWNTPPDFCSISKPEGHVCFDVINKGSNQLIVINDLPQTPYAISDPNISAYKLVTYLGKAVLCDGEYVGSICALFQNHHSLTLEHEQIFTIIASALGNEESRRSAEKNLRESEELFRSAFLTSPDSININRLSDGMYFDINEGFTKLTDYTREDVIGKTSLELSIWDNPEDRNKLVKGLQVNGYVDNLEAVFRIKGGGTKTALMSARVFSIRGVPHILSVTRDMTERQQTMQALKENEQKFRSVVENAFDGIYLISGHRFVFYNQRFCEIMGYSAEEIASEWFNFAITLTDKSRDLIEQRRQARINGEEIPGIYEFEIRTKSGELKEVEVSTVKLDSDDQVTVLGIMRDVTERKVLFEELIKAKDKAEEVNILKSRLLANLSHEIRTPLNGILGFAELLREDIQDDSLKSMAEIIYTSGYRLLHTLNSILDLSVIESQFNTMKLKTVSLNKLADEVSTLFKPNIIKKGIKLSIVTKQEEILVKADEELITKILNNLINNALKFTNKGEISVTTSIESKDSMNFGCITIKDTGIGIKKEYLEIIFDEFRQVSEGQSRSYDGSGLGLHISKRFAEMMQGTITVLSTPGSGSAFTLWLPLK